MARPAAHDEIDDRNSAARESITAPEGCCLRQPGEPEYLLGCEPQPGERADRRDRGDE
jgi:hypothetical protein